MSLELTAGPTGPTGPIGCTDKMYYVNHKVKKSVEKSLFSTPSQLPERSAEDDSALARKTRQPAGPGTLKAD